MMLHLITGRANSGKTGRAYGRLKEALERGDRCALVLPAKPDVDRARRELTGAAPLGLDIVTFDEFAHSLWSTYGDGRGVVRPEQRSLVLAALAGADRSMARLVSRCIGELCEQTGSTWRSVTPHDIAEHTGKLSSVIQAYALWLESEDQAEPAEVRQELPEAAATDYDFVAVHRFADFTPSQLSMIKRLSRNTEMLVTLTWEKDFAATSAVDQLISRLGADQHDALPEDVYNTDPVLTLLSGTLFGQPIPLPNNQAVTFIVSEGREAQARAIAKEIRRALESGVVESPQEVAVVFRNAVQHRSALSRAFQAEGLQADFDVKSPLAGTAFGWSLTAAITAVAHNHPEALLSIVRSGVVSADVDLRRGMEASLRASGHRDVHEMLRRLEPLDPALAGLLLELRKLREAPVDERVIVMLCDLTRLLYARSLMNTGIQDAGSAEYDAAAEASAVRALESIRACTSISIFLPDVLHLLQSQKVAPKRVERVGRVQVTSASRVRGRRFGLVIVAGLNAGEFPGVPDETIVNGNSVYEVLKSFGETPSYPDPLFEQLLFYDVITRARKSLSLVACVTDEEAEPMRLSPFFEMVADCFRSPDDMGLPPHTLEPLASLPCMSAESKRVRLRAECAAESTSNERARAARYRATRSITEIVPAEWDMGDKVFSASQIEAYLACPYRWYRDHVLRPKELERDYGALEEGVLAHELLASVYKGLLAAGFESLGASGMHKADSLLDEAFSASITNATSLAEKIGAMRARAWVVRILNEDATRGDSFFPRLLEHDFGSNGSPARVGSMLLKGRVDRIDVDEEGRAFIVDYKRRVGSDSGARATIREGKVQIPLYIAAMKEQLGIDLVGGVYRGLSTATERGLVLQGALPGRRFTRGDELPQEEFEELVTSAVRMSEEAVEGMRAGVIKPEPRSRKTCGFCDVRGLCGGAL